MSYTGCLVSLNCGDVLGTYQGQVLKVDNSSQSLTLRKPFRNGVQCEFPEVTISACDIKELAIVKSADEAQKVLPKNATPSKLSKQAAESYDIAASPGRIAEPRNDTSANSSSHSVHLHDNGYHSLSSSSLTDRSCRDNNGTYCMDKGASNGHASPLNPASTRERKGSLNGYGYRNNNHRYTSEDPVQYINRYTPTKEDSFRGRVNSDTEGLSPQKTSVPRKIEFKKRPNSRQDCFSAPVDNILDDFDFEKNLKLFDKKAVYEEIESSNPDLVHIADKITDKYRHDENVLQSKPVTFTQIQVPKDCGVSYTTDSGLIVPSIDYELLDKLFDTAEVYGYSLDRRLEMVGRSSSEMVLQLLGGSSRLNPQNGHQLPTVLVLCGPHVQGAQGLACARHLLNHGVRTFVFLPNFLRMIPCVELELRLYEMCSGKRYSMDKDIPTCSIDMIINCMDSHENSFLKDQAWYQTHVRWIGQSRAPVFTIDPPIETVDIVPKWCLYPVLPLARIDNTSQVYLCDLGLPKNVFKSAGIKYRSPFGHKFIIPLHRQT